MRATGACLQVLATLLLLATVAVPASAAGVEERIYVITDYRYLPGGPGDSPDTGLSLCGTRCNAISTNYLNIVEPGGWRLIRVAAGRELTMDLKNPFMTGTCVCVADEYVVKVDDLNQSRKSAEKRRTP